jgi:site-specific recombinase XerD
VRLLHTTSTRNVPSKERGDCSILRTETRASRARRPAHVPNTAADATAQTFERMRRLRAFFALCSRSGDYQVKVREALFISTRNSRIFASAVWKMIKGYRRKARISKDLVGPHMLRHTFATTLLANAENLRTIQALMNHKNIATTLRYLHSHNAELAKAVNRICIE